MSDATDPTGPRRLDLDPHAFRRQLAALAQRNDSYNFLYAALPYLRQFGDDHEVRLMAVGQLARLGLFGPATELFDDLPAELADRSEIAQARRTMASQPTGHVPWRQFAERFTENVGICLRRGFLNETDARRLEQSIAGLELYRCNDGNFELSRRDAGKPREWLPGLANWAASTRNAELRPSQPNTLCPPLAVDGVAFGHALAELYDGTRKMLVTYSPRIHVLEPNLAQFAVWLHVAATPEMLADERVLVWLGHAGPEEFIEYHRRNPQIVGPQGAYRQIGWGPGAEPVAQPAIDRLAAEARERTQQALAQVRSSVRSRDAAYYAERFANRKHRPLRILGVTSRFTTFLQYSMRDIQHAARSAGHRFEIVMEPDDHTPIAAHPQILQRVADLQPDLILIIDHNRREFGELYEYAVPLCNWIQDDLPNLFGPGRGADLHPFDIVVGTIGSLRADASGYPRDQWRSVPTPVSSRVFSSEPIDAEELRKYRCDVSFVTNLSIPPERFLEQTLGQTDSLEMRRLVEALYETLPPRIARGDVPGSVAQVIRQTQQLATDLGFEMTDAQADHVRQAFTDRLINIFFRQQVLEWAADLGLDLHIYGRGWEEHPRLKRFARGVAAHGRELKCIYQASRINIQAISTGAVHQRLMEALFSGGFVAIRRTPIDSCSRLVEAVARRVAELDIRDEAELWNASDATLRRHVRELNDRLYAPARLYPGFVHDLHIARERGFRNEAGALLPHYEQVAFGTRAEFEHLVKRFLDDADERERITGDHRAAVVDLFSYDAVLERVLQFAAERFSRL
ncbi:MAG: hypothetical protein D6744_05050, partial [Planctomycetota bacterium]